MQTGLLVVDVQPAYDSYCRSIAAKVAQRINNTRKPTIVMWVGDGLTCDTEESVRDYLHRFGARPGKLAAARFVEKDYGFFRPWMDGGVDPEHIVRVGKTLLRKGLTSSEQLADWELYGLPESAAQQEILEGAHLTGDPLHLPAFDASAFRYLAGFETCGGGARECLAEIELWLDMQDTTYRRLTQLTY